MTTAGQPDLSAIAARLTELEEERGILRTLYRYGHSIDYGLDQDWVDCFTEDGVWEVRRAQPPMATRYPGRDALAAWFASARNQSASLHSKHLVQQPLITRSGDTATVVSYFARLFHVPGEPPTVASFGRYHDTMVKCADGRWRFTERIAEVET